MKCRSERSETGLFQFVNASKAALLQLLVAAAQPSTFDRIIDCPTYPVPVKTIGLADAVQQLRLSMINLGIDAPAMLARLYSKVQPIQDRKRLGQFFTSLEAAKWALTVAHPIENDRVCDAGAGTGIFAAALLHSRVAIDWYVGVENDPILALCAAHALESMRANQSYRIWYANFLLLDEEAFVAQSLEPPNVVIANPPFVRYHHLLGRAQIRSDIKSALGITLSSLSGSGSYFLARGAQLVGNPVSSMDKSNRRLLFFLPQESAGAAHVQKLREDLRLTHNWTYLEYKIANDQTGVDRHRSNAAALFSVFEQGKHTQKPFRLGSREGACVQDVIHVRRGISTGRNEFFVLTEDDVQRRRIDPKKWLKKVLPTRIHIEGTRFSEEDWERFQQSGHPCWLLALPNEKVELDVPIQEYLKEGLRKGFHTTPTARALRTWYSLPIPADPPDVFITYFFRGKPRFILNQAKVFNLTNILSGRFTNRQLHPNTKELVVKQLNGQVEKWMKQRIPGREYKGGLRKIEPRELSMLPIKFEIFQIANPNASEVRTRTATLF